MRRKFALFFAVAGAAAVLDQATKAWVLKSIPYTERMAVIADFFDFRHVHNRGAIFGIFSTSPDGFRVPAFFVISILALIVMIVMVALLKKEDVAYRTAIALIFGGAIGNFIDRVRFGYVIDFLDVYLGRPKAAAAWLANVLGSNHWHTFNVADASILAGVAIFAYLSIDEYRKTRRPPASDNGVE